MITLWSVLDRVIGLKLEIILTSLPAFGISLRYEVLWDGGRQLFARLCCHD